MCVCVCVCVCVPLSLSLCLCLSLSLSFFMCACLSISSSFRFLFWAPFSLSHVCLVGFCIFLSVYLLLLSVSADMHMRVISSYNYVPVPFLAVSTSRPCFLSMDAHSSCLSHTCCTFTDDTAIRLKVERDLAEKDAKEDEAKPQPSADTTRSRQ